MITDRTKKRLIAIAKELRHIPQSNHKHFSFLLNKRKIISIGWNNGWKSHPIANKYGHRFNSIHSELSCIINCNTSIDRLTMVNIRIMSDGTLGRAFPCECCTKMLIDYGFENIVCSDYKGRFHDYYLRCYNEC